MAIDSLSLFVIVALSIVGATLCISMIACIVVHNRYASTTAPPPGAMKSVAVGDQPQPAYPYPPPPQYGYPPPGYYGYPPQAQPGGVAPYGGLAQEPAPQIVSVKPQQPGFPTAAYSHGQQRVNPGDGDDVAQMVAAAQ